jgi:chromate reductase
MRPRPASTTGDRHDKMTPEADISGKVEIAAIAGSLRAASWARALLWATARLLPPNVQFTFWDGLKAIPLFNEDLESGPTPIGVHDLRELIKRSDALLIVTPEYNQSIPGVMKNVLDWASRPYGQTVLKDKLVAVVGTSPLPTGAATALAEVERILTLLGADVVEAELAIGQVQTRIDAERLMITDTELASRMTQLLVNLATRATAKESALADV